MAAFGFSTTPSTTTSAAASSSFIYLTSLPTHNNSYTNFTSPLTSILSTGPPESVSWASIFLILVMGALSVFTVLGNLIVLLSYYIDKNIRQPSNYFIFSLAVSDLVCFYLCYKKKDFFKNELAELLLLQHPYHQVHHMVDQIQIHDFVHPLDQFVKNN
jgi:hypothetical protein